MNHEVAMSHVFGRLEIARTVTNDEVAAALLALAGTIQATCSDLDSLSSISPALEETLPKAIADAVAKVAKRP